MSRVRADQARSSNSVTAALADPVNRIHVVAGVLSDSASRVLVAQRPVGKALAGKWEFPGGKLGHGEDARSALQRELREELGIEVRSATPLIQFTHVYPELEVYLDVWRVTHFDGHPVALEGQQLVWLAPAELDSVDLLEADAPIVSALCLPPVYAITPPQLPTISTLEQLLNVGNSLIQLRCPNASPDQMAAVAEQAIRVAGDARLLINGDPAITVALARRLGAAGVHLPARYLDAIRAHDCSGLLVGASCHDQHELAQAEKVGVNFAVLGPVEKTVSHPQSAVMGWRKFAELVATTRLPVYALGGMSPAATERAQLAGAQGIAGISAFWETQPGG